VLVRGDSGARSAWMYLKTLPGKTFPLAKRMTPLP
jgi:hypothetical protein